MPNWCLNKLTISHPEQDKITEFVKAYKEGKTCEHYLPMPEGEDWYSWNSDNWGTKWDIGSDKNEEHGLHPTVVGNEATMSFDSAWAPPIGLYKNLHELGFTVDATYFEPGMGFCGIWHDGDDLCTEYADKDMIPVRIWNDYNLKEFFED